MAIKYRLNDRTLSQLHMVEAPMTKHGRMTNVYAFGDEGVIFVANESEAKPAYITFWNSIDRRIIQTPLTFDEQHNADEFVSPDGKTVALIYPGAVSVFDTRTGKRVLKNEDLVRTAKSDPFDINLEWNRQSKAFSLGSAGYIQLFRLGQH